MIIIIVSLLFSIVIYTIASKEVGSRIDFLPTQPGVFRILDERSLHSLRENQVREAEESLIYALFVTNVAIWIVGGVGC